jgi:protein-disulfide isomerase
MRSLVLCLLCVLVACASRSTAVHGPSAVPQAASTAVKFPTREGATDTSPFAPSSVERIYELAPTDGAPWLGAAEAKVTLEVCSDFQCPYCAQLVPTLHQLHENYEELLRVVWRNCPLPMHDAALLAAEAALEVLAQRGSPGFWAYHDVLFTQQSDLSEGALVHYASTIAGVDAERLRSALRDHRHVPHVQREVMALVDSGAAAGGLGTPVSFINGRMLVGAQPYEKFEDAVERALQEQPEARSKAEADSKAEYPMARLRHLLVQYRGAREAAPGVTRTKAEAEARAQELRKRIAVAPGEFARIAHEESDCPSAKQGGELGRFTQGELEPRLEVALFILEPGQVSEVVESPFGFHVLLREP